MKKIFSVISIYSSGPVNTDPMADIITSENVVRRVHEKTRSFRLLLPKDEEKVLNPALI